MKTIITIASCERHQVTRAAMTATSASSGKHQVISAAIKAITSASGGKHQVIWVDLDQGKHSEKLCSNTLHAWRIGLAFRGVFGADFLTPTANQPITSSASLSLPG
jgi:hypothetical protein